jgi:voltage-gated potassium channel Kch
VPTGWPGCAAAPVRTTIPVVVIGLGRFGTAIALELERQGTEVLAIDSVNRTVQDLSSRLTHAVMADCTDIAALQQLGVGVTSTGPWSPSATTWRTASW